MITLAEIFQDNMILQQKKPVRFWGTSDEEGKLEILCDGENWITADIQTGDFEVYAPEKQAYFNVEISFIFNGKKDITLKNVAIGEIWIAGGQSNMDYPLICDKEADSAVERIKDTHIRLYDIAQYAFEGERQEGLKSEAHSFKWFTAKADEKKYLSAVGLYFAETLRKKMPDVPVGIICCNWGGTKASAWLDKSLLTGDLQVYIDEYEDGIKDLYLEKYYKQNRKMREQAAKYSVSPAALDDYRIEATKAPGKAELMLIKLMDSRVKLGPNSEHRPGCLYENMLKYIAGFTVAGVIWYQGESDENHADIYDQLFSTMIKCWRDTWKDELPFCFVQLAPFDTWRACSGENYPAVRAAQQRVAKNVEKAYMASIMDIGSQYDIHPKEKRPVGQRLALLALKNVYEFDVKCDAPEIDMVTVSKDKIMLHFANVYEGLKEKGMWHNLVKVKSGDNVLSGKCRLVESADSGIIDTIEVALLTGTNTSRLTVEFAYKPFLVMGLFNSADLPAKPMAPVTASYVEY